MKNRPLHLVCCSLLITTLASSRTVQAEGGISTDGTAGAAQTLSGSQVTIPQDLGTTVGGNLFHSFDQFNINTGQTVTFTENTPNALNNVISRVTGGSSSDINGTLSATPNGHANFYLINPAGIVFGKEAQIDVAGAFHASTAKQLNFTDGGLLNADKIQGSSLSSVEPANFGFLASSAANNGLLQIDGAQLTAKEGQTIDLVARQIDTDHNATLNAPAGEIRLVAMQGAGKVSLDRTAGALPLPDEMPATSNAGNINIHDTDIKTTGNGGGRIGIWGGDVVVSKQSADRKYIDANNIGVQNAGALQGIEIKTNNLALNGVAVRAHAQGNGNAGNIRLQSSQDTVLRRGGRIVSDTFGNIAGNTSNINLSTGKDLVIDGLDTPENSITGIRTDASENSTGKAGDIADAMC
ncbi:MAG: filamentous hemagglutinin N-terminal domain-containing protein [Methylococcaceae bacterium]|nr:filamentous hemagglutinin N-terminal domain-containing protein [Methylococcaceae bacterium]